MKKLLKSEVNKIKDLNIENDVRTDAKLEVEIFDYCVELAYNGEFKFRLSKNSSVEAWENSSVVAWGNSSVEAWGNSSVVARGNSSVVARGNSSVAAWENSSVSDIVTGKQIGRAHV